MEVGAALGFTHLVLVQESPALRPREHSAVLAQEVGLPHWRPLATRSPSAGAAPKGEKQVSHAERGVLHTRQHVAHDGRCPRRRSAQMAQHDMACVPVLDQGPQGTQDQEAT
jgi:hypothetical protein